jgi:hypothetical protein
VKISIYTTCPELLNVSLCKPRINEKNVPLLDTCISNLGTFQELFSVEWFPAGNFKLNLYDGSK